MTWITDSLPVLAVLLVAAGLALGALSAAKWLRLDTIPGTSAPGDSPEHTIERLASLADLARQGGIMSAETEAPRSHSPLVRQGLALLVDGRSTPDIRRALETALDQAVFTPRFTPASLLPGACNALGIAGLIAALVASVTLATSAAPNAGAMWLACLIFPSAALLILAPVMQQRTSGAASRRLLDGMLAIEAVCLISAGRDGHAVRVHLRQLLPIPSTDRASAAAA